VVVDKQGEDKVIEQDLLAWGLEHYFSVIPWAGEKATKILDEKDMDAAVEYLRKVCGHGSQEASGPGKPSYSTRGGKVLLYQPGKSLGEPDLEYNLRQFCR